MESTKRRRMHSQVRTDKDPTSVHDARHVRLTDLRRFCPDYPAGIRPEMHPLDPFCSDMFSRAPGTLPWGHGMCDVDNATPLRTGNGSGRGSSDTGAAVAAAGAPSAATVSGATRAPASRSEAKATGLPAETEQARIASSFARVSSQLLQQFVGSHARRVLTAADSKLGWGGLRGSTSHATTDRFQCRSTAADVEQSPWLCSVEGCSNTASEHCFNCESDMCPECDTRAHTVGGGVPAPHLHERVTYRQGYEQLKNGDVDTRLVWPELPPVFTCPQDKCTSRTYRRQPWREDGGIARVIDLSR